MNPGLGSVVRRGVLVSTDMVPRTFLGEEYKVGAPAWLATAVSEFGAACHAKLAGPGDREAAIRAPLEGLLRTVGTHLRVPAEFYDEVRDSARQVRPDYGVAVKGAITGYIEVKAPDKPIDPATFRGHDLRQWERQKDLPNLLYTNGTEWRLYRDGQPHGEPIVFTGGRLDDAGESLTTPPEFERLITDFLNWKPAPITSVGALVRAIAPLTRLLRGEVVDQLADERQAIAAGAEEYTQPFTGLARDWRNLLFPQADDKTFADGYAQAVAFALLLARTEGIRVDGVSLHEVGRKLSTQHSLMGRALQLLTDDVAADFKVTLDLLVRIIGAVDWPRVRKGKRDTYLHLYEHFLEQYDNELRKQSGTYYTPREVVDHMVRLTEEALVTRLGKAKGFRDDAVVTVDPAMGTGTYLLTILERAAEQAAAHDGPGAVPGALAEVAKRLVGFELQMGPYAVAELRTADLLNLHGATKSGALNLYVTNTLDDPHAGDAELGHNLVQIAQSRRRANKVKASTPVTVVIGNPPYKELAAGEGSWVESGSAGDGKKARGILEDFFDAGASRFKAKLKNLYVYFWRWATWKVWESTPQASDGDAGVVCFISTAGYLTGPGFTGMRRYLRKHASEGWIIDLTPEGHQPDVPTRIFPGVRQPLAIGLFVRRPGTDPETPATIHYRQVSGRQADKFDALAGITLDDDTWQVSRTDWTSPFTAAAEGEWDDYPALSDLMPWYSPGVFPTRTWVYAPARSILKERWAALVSAPAGEKPTLFKEGSEPRLYKSFDALPGIAPSRKLPPLANETSTTPPEPVRVGFRSFDRQWIIPDARAIHRARTDLWAARQDGQIFTVEQHIEPIKGGPGLVFTALVPDTHHFNNRGGRALPLLHPDGTPNFAPGLAQALGQKIGQAVTPGDVVAYVAGVVAHPAYTTGFADQLTTPGIRVPITADSGLWAEAVEVGRLVLWLHTFGETNEGADRPKGDVRFAADDPRQPRYLAPVSAMPTTMTYDAARAILRVGDGEFGPVIPAVWAYEVGGKNVLKSWFNYRKAEPGGKKTSPLDKVHTTTWPTEWSTDLIDVLSVLTRVVNLEPAQADLLERILAGPLLARENLTAAGVRWPVTPADRKPRKKVMGGEGTLQLDGL